MKRPFREPSIEIVMVVAILVIITIVIVMEILFVCNPGLAQAENLYRQVLAARSGRLGAEHPLTLSALREVSFN